MPPAGIRRCCLGFAALVAGITACGRSGAPEAEDALTLVADGGGLVDPRPTPLPTPHAFGDGHDGAYAPPAGTHRPTPCWKLVGTTGGGVALAAGQGTGGVAIDAGDLLFLHQTQGHVATSGDTTPIALTGTAGIWQLALVLGSDAGLVQLSPPPVFAFRSAGEARAQACLFPQYESASAVDVTLEAHPWDGETGGIVGFLVRETFSLDGTTAVTASGRGFRGGPAQAGGGGFVDQLDTPAANSSRKGEGIDRRSFALYGKGNYANGGGGGNATDGGGGGGGGAGAGGTGGRTFQNNDPLRRAFGGASVAAIPERLHFGGGGGAGQDNGGGGPPPGGPGGGIVFVAARTWAGAATARVSAAGTDGATPRANGNNGGGGGGGGGTVLLHGSVSGFAGVVDVHGGKGGNCSNDHGPGGGGGAGSIRADEALGGTTSLAGGANGATANTDPRGAAPGATGTLTEDASTD